MKAFIVAMILGALTEFGLCVALLVGGFGPCGPASPVSGAILLLHAPGLALAQSLHLPESATLVLIPALYALFWSALWQLVLLLGWKREA